MRIVLNNYKKLEKKFTRLNRLNHLASIGHWDEAAMMPDGGAGARGDALAELAVIEHEIMSSSEMAELFLAVEEGRPNLSQWQAANFFQMKREWQRATALSADFVERRSLASSKCQMAWREMRSQNNWTDYLPYLDLVIALSKEEASIRAELNGCRKYDALIDLYEPGMNCEKIDVVFNKLKKILPGFRKAVMERQNSEPVIYPGGTYPKEKQQTLAIKTMEYLGFDFNRGRLDTSHHPFCGGVPEDVRITTRYNESDFSEGMMGVIHETGHASYEQGLPVDWLEQPVGRAVGLGFHEGQSLLFEMQMARGLDFLTGYAPIVEEFLSDESDPKGFWSVENQFKLATRVMPGYIRVNADEVTYPMHVILRYEIEKMIIEENLNTADIPEVWNQKSKDYLGLSTEGNYKDGVMQDLHWTDGSFGYFPTYTLGAVTAAQLFFAAKKKDPNIPEQISTGNFSSLRGWLMENIWSKGSLLNSEELMVSATGESLNPKYFLDHLEGRYLS